MGVERFNLLFKTNKFNFNQSLFTKKRVCKDIREGDAHYTKLGKYEKVKALFGVVMFI